MTEWQVVGVIVVLVGLVASIVTPMLKFIKENTQAVTKLGSSVDRLDSNLGDLASNNREAHRQLFERTDNHERRLTVLETKEDNRNDK